MTMEVSAGTVWQSHCDMEIRRLTVYTLKSHSVTCRSSFDSKNDLTWDEAGICPPRSKENMVDKNRSRHGLYVEMRREGL